MSTDPTFFGFCDRCDGYIDRRTGKCPTCGKRQRTVHVGAAEILGVIATALLIATLAIAIGLL